MSGRVSTAEAATRVPTSTDGVVASEIVDRWLTSATEAVEKAGLVTSFPAAGYQRANGILNKREADLLLEPGQYRVFEIELSLGGGAKTGTLTVALPIVRKTVHLPEMAKADGVRAHLPNLPVTLQVVLARLPLEIGKLRSLAKGDLLDIPAEALRQVRLESKNGKAVGSARLGQLGGYRAVLVAGKDGGAPDMTAGLAGVGALPPMPEEGPTLPDIPPLPATTALPDLPALPVSGDMPALTDLPDLPDLPAPTDLPELPDLPDLPDLPGV